MAKCNMACAPQAVVKFGPLLWPKDFRSSEEFAAAAEGAVRRQYAAIAIDASLKQDKAAGLLKKGE